MSYEKEFEIFSANINQAARSFYYHQEIQRQVYEDGIKHEEMPQGHFQDSKLYQAMQANAKFWTDYKHSSIVFSVITLGKIFDKQSNSHKLKRLIETAENSGLFTKERLRERKIKGSSNALEWIDNYMQTTYALSHDDFARIRGFGCETRTKWEKVKALRHKIYAHQEVMDDSKKAEIFEQSKYSAFEEIITRLLTIENIFQEAFDNGKVPDFEYKNLKVRESVARDVSSLLARLSQ